MTSRVLLFALAACSSSSKTPAEPEPATASLLDCTKVAEHVATTVATSKPRSGATHAVVKDMVSVRCKTDAWSDETRQCLYAITTVQQGRACATGMTDAQREAIETHARSLRAEAAAPGSPDDQSSDWVKHVVEE